MQEAIDKIYGYLTEYSLNIVAAILILVVGRWVAKILSRLVGNIMKRTKVDLTITTFIQNLSYVTILVLVIIAAVQKLGIPTASLIAVLGAAGLAIGLALQGSLANFASGIIMLILKPFKLGDVVEIAGAIGTVQEIQIFNTIINTPDNIRVIIPNSHITGGNIKNYTSNGTRRIDLVIGISYDDDILKAKKVIENILTGDTRVLKSPAPAVVVSALADSSVNLAVQPWVNVSDYGAVLFDMNEKIKIALENNGVTIPYPQRDIHIKNNAKI